MNHLLNSRFVLILLTLEIAARVPGRAKKHCVVADHYFQQWIALSSSAVLLVWSTYRNMARELSNSPSIPKLLCYSSTPHHHQEGQMAGSAARGPSTDLDLWLKGHFCRVDVGVMRIEMWDFMACKMVYLTTRLLCCCCAQENTRYIHTSITKRK